MIGPFTEVREIEFDRPTRSKSASSWPFTVESSAWPSSRSALMLPLTAEAFTEPATPLIERPPLISLTFSRLAVRGTVMRYSTLAGRSASVPAYCVRMETRSFEESTTIRASFSCRGSRDRLMASTRTSSRSHVVMRTSP